MAKLTPAQKAAATRAKSTIFNSGLNKKMLRQWQGSLKGTKAGAAYSDAKFRYKRDQSLVRRNQRNLAIAKASNVTQLRAALRGIKGAGSLGTSRRGSGASRGSGAGRSDH